MALTSANLLELLMSLQEELLRSLGTGVTDNDRFVAARRNLLSDPEVAELLPDWLKSVRTLDQFRHHVWKIIGSSDEGDDYVYGELDPAIRHVESAVLRAESVHPMFRKVSIPRSTAMANRPVASLSDIERGAAQPTIPTERASTEVTAAERKRENDGGRRVFLVHGHDHLTRDAVDLFLRTIGLQVEVLSKLAGGGKTVIEAFEARALQADCAVVLLTPDDTGGPKDGTQRLRARQNVILELGYFMGKMGRSKVIALLAPGVEGPSDINGVIYVALDDGAKWKGKLAQELVEMGIDIDHKAAYGA